MNSLSRIGSFLVGRGRSDADQNEADDAASHSSSDGEVQIARHSPSGRSADTAALDDTLPLHAPTAGPSHAPTVRERKDTPFRVKAGAKSSTPAPLPTIPDDDDVWVLSPTGDFGSPIMPARQEVDVPLHVPKVRFAEETNRPSRPRSPFDIDSPYQHRQNDSVVSTWEGSQGQTPNKSGYSTSRSASPVTPPTSRRYISKPRNFDGTNWASYRLHFMSCVRSNNWREPDAAQILTAHLSGEAAFVLTSRHADEWTLEELLRVLDARYEVAGPDYIVRGKLRRTNQRPGEALQHFADSIMKITWSRYGINGADLAREQFIFGLCDSRMQKHVAKRVPDSLEAALLIARQYEETDRWVQSSQRKDRRVARVTLPALSDTDEDDDDVVIPAPIVHAPKVKINQVSKTEPPTTLETLAANLQQVQKKLDVLNTRVVAPRPPQRYNNNNDRPNNNYPPPRNDQWPRGQGNHGNQGNWGNQRREQSDRQANDAPAASSNHAFRFGEGKQGARPANPPAK